MASFSWAPSRVIVIQTTCGVFVAFNLPDLTYTLRVYAERCVHYFVSVHWHLKQCRCWLGAGKMYCG